MTVKTHRGITPPSTGHKNSSGGSYIRFFAMIATSMMVMFFLMYLHSYELIDHA